MLGKVRATTSEGRMPAAVRRVAAESTRAWRRAWVRSNLVGTAIARREGKSVAAFFSIPVRVKPSIPIFSEMFYLRKLILRIIFRWKNESKLAVGIRRASHGWLRFI